MRLSSGFPLRHSPFSLSLSLCSEGKTNVMKELKAVSISHMSHETRQLPLSSHHPSFPSLQSWRHFNEQERSGKRRSGKKRTETGDVRRRGEATKGRSKEADSCEDSNTSHQTQSSHIRGNEVQHHPSPLLPLLSLPLLFSTRQQQKPQRMNE